MGNFKFHKKSGMGKGFGHRDHGDRELFEAVCSACGKRTTLPFKPNGKKPVYCNDCFKANGGADDSRRPGFVKRSDYGRRPDFVKRSFSPPQNNEQIEVLNRKIDRLTDMVKTLLAGGKKDIAKKMKNATPLVNPETTPTV